MTDQQRMELLAESLGYWRKANQTAEQGNAESVVILMMIAAAYGSGGMDSAMSCMFAAHVNPRYIEAIRETLASHCGTRSNEDDEQRRNELWGVLNAVRVATKFGKPITELLPRIEEVLERP